jgi:hypothetical protein
MMVKTSAFLLVGLLILLRAPDDFKRERGGPSDNVKNAAEGKAPPELKADKWLNTPGEKPLTWKDLRGKVVLVDLWAYW